MTKRLSTRAMRKRHTDRIQASALIDQLQAHVLGELEGRPQVVRRIVDRVLAALKDGELTAERRKVLEQELSGMLTRQALDMSKVRGAEILLRKTLPDLANTEHRSEVNHNHVVLLPAGMTSQEWQAQVRTIPHEAPKN